VEAIYKGNPTGIEYTRYNNAFIKWFTIKYGKKEVTEQEVRQHIQEHSNAGKSTKMMVAALKFRFNYCEKRSFDFSRLIKEAAPDRKHPHRALKNGELSAIFDSLKPYPLMHLACRILLDMSARVQDLVIFRFDSFECIKGGMGSSRWVAHKTAN
jgi:hypothetical protein